MLRCRLCLGPHEDADCQVDDTDPPPTFAPDRHGTWRCRGCGLSAGEVFEGCHETGCPVPSIAAVEQERLLGLRMAGLDLPPRDVGPPLWAPPAPLAPEGGAPPAGGGGSNTPTRKCTDPSRASNGAGLGDPMHDDAPVPCWSCGGTGGGSFGCSGCGGTGVRWGADHGG